MSTVQRNGQCLPKHWLNFGPREGTEKWTISCQINQQWWIISHSSPSMWAGEPWGNSGRRIPPKLTPIESVMPSSHLIVCRPLLPPSIFPSIGSFQMNQFFTTGSLSIGVSASKSDLPMNIQDWFPLGWTNWISLQSKGLSRVVSNTTVQKHQFFGVSFLYSPTLTSIHDSWKNHRFD